MLSGTRFHVAVVALAIVGCGGSAEDAADTNEATLPEATLSMESPDPDAAANGENLFASRGCVGCHHIGGGRSVGPDLLDVANRREHGWLVGMITRPDSMIVGDDTAMGLLAEYHTPMPNLRLSAAEAEQIIAYLIAESSQ